jgi:hypothetical protein
MPCIWKFHISLKEPVLQRAHMGVTYFLIKNRQGGKKKPGS